MILFSYDSLIDPAPGVTGLPGRRRPRGIRGAASPRRRIPLISDRRANRWSSPGSTTSSSPGYLLAITAFGSWFARFQKTTRDYFLTGRSVPWWAICFTIVATETSTLSFIGVPAGAYAGNMTFLQLALGYIVGRVLVSVLFIPAYFRGELFTSYELLHRRFGPSREEHRPRSSFVVTRTLADGIRLFATALVISVVTARAGEPGRSSCSASR